MKVVYSLLAAFIVGGILIPIAMAQYPGSSVPRYPTMSASTATLKSPTTTPSTPPIAPTFTSPTESRSPYSVAQAPAPKSAGTGTLPSGTSSTTNTTRIVTEPRTSAPAPRGAEPVPVQEPIAGFPIAIAPTQHVPLSLGALQPTPEMWFYEQMRQDYNNPQLQVRRNSEQAAADRKARLAASAWFGVDNSRPMAYTTPHMYHYSPTWTGNSRRPWFWSGSTTSVNVNVNRTPTLGVSGIGTW